MTTILLVEDYEEVRDMLSRRLRRHGFEVSVAVDGRQAVACCEAECPDLVLLDMNLPETELEAFLDAGEPPVYFGFGSIRAPADLARVMIASARAHGRRAIVSRGWAELALVDDAPDCLAIGEVNQQALFPRVAAVVHHGGAGTTTAAARAGAPQVVIPQHYDQPYWAGRVDALGIGTAHDGSTPTEASLTRALERTLHPDVAGRARSVAAAVRGDGAQVAARRLTLEGSASLDSRRGPVPV